ncbi:MAG: DMT family transporter [Boseongicola sp.]|nr:DMT family transporter [Boseongicola sp.]
MVAAMAGFAVEDMFLKSAAATVPIGQVMIWFGLGGSLIFAVWAVAQGQSLFPRAVIERTMMVRNAFEIFGRLFFTLAIVLTPLSSATAILQATPIVVVAGAALFFGETVGWRRWTAILVGLGGVLVILQPGAESFTTLSILAVLGMLGFAGRDLATRAAPKTMSGPVLGVWGFWMILIAGVGFSIWEGAAFVMPGAAFLPLVGACMFGVAGYSSLTQAMRTGDVSAVTPFRYSRLLFGVGFGVLIFGETLEPNMIIGSLIIVAAGLYILARGRS